ncbi:MAG: lipoate--protein ligase family protein [Gemmatimonadaceae bacterium]
MRTPPRTGAWNMAIDEALLARARNTGEIALRVYAWSSPTLSFGRNQSALRHYDRERIRESGLNVVRRPTGGRAVIHDREVTYSVTAPASSIGTLNESCARISRLLKAALLELGVDVSSATAGGTVHGEWLGPTPCFRTPSPGELVCGGRKLVGSAQWREDGALLQHGSILISNDQSTIDSLLIDRGGSQSAEAPATLEAELGRVPLGEEVVDALFNAVRNLEDPDATELTLDGSLVAAELLARRRYEDERWTWRR